MTFKLDNFKGEKRILLAEDVGFHIGDGHMGSANYNDGYKRCAFIYCGDALKDVDYFSNFLIPRKRELFGLNKNNTFIRKGGIYFCFNSKDIFLFFISMGIPFGKKDKVRVPQWIRNDSIEIKVAFLRGLFDSDGCFTVKKKYKKVYYYPVITISMKSRKLTEDVKQVLKEIGMDFTSCFLRKFDKRTVKTYEQYQIDINGVERITEWVEIIGFNNKRHMQKYKKWARGDSNSGRA